MNKVTITATVLLSTLSLTALASMSTDKKGHYTHIVLSNGSYVMVGFSEKTSVVEIRTGDSQQSNVHVSIYKNGALIYSDILYMEGEQTKIDLSTFGPGTYDVYISDNKDTFYVATVPVNTQTNHKQ